MSNEFKLGQSYGKAAAVSPHDTNNLTNPCDALWIGTGGNIKVVLGGDTVTFTSVPNGTCLAIRATRVFNTDTTASNVVQVWNPVT